MLSVSTPDLGGPSSAQNTSTGSTSFSSVALSSITPVTSSVASRVPSPGNANTGVRLPHVAREMITGIVVGGLFALQY